MSKSLRAALIIFLVGALALVLSAMYKLVLQKLPAKGPAPQPPIGTVTPPVDTYTPPATIKTPDGFSMALEWLAPGLVQISGTAQVPDVSFQLTTGSTVLAQSDVQVKSGRYIGAMEVPTDRGKDLRMVAVTPEGKQSVTLGQVALNRDIPSGIMYSNNFRVKPVQRVSGQEIIIEGHARAFEAAFMVEVRHGDRLLAQRPVMASEGGPAYGHFQRSIIVPEPIPAGAEVWYITSSAKDGSLTVELVQVVR